MRSRKELANTLRILAMDAVENAHSGHPGAAMGMADMAEALWRGAFRHNPANPKWIDRDRFVLSNGHASMLLYALLHLTGYDLSMDDIRNFRQWDSRTPGHPEYGRTPGVEATTGPLGQGLGMAVGMALSERLLAQTFNRDGFPLVNHYTYAFVGDGCLMEGISQEACSLAGLLKLGKLIVFYDDNGISIDGKTKDWMPDEIPVRFAASGWQVLRHVDGHDGDTLDAAITLAKAVTDKPTIICCKTIIGYGSPNKSGSAACHGSPLGSRECMATRIVLGWPTDPFEIPEDIRKAWDCREKGAQLESEWNDLHTRYAAKYPELAAEFDRRIAGDLPEDWIATMENILSLVVAQKNGPDKGEATRVSSQKLLENIAQSLPELFGGSADLTESVGTWHSGSVRVNIDKRHGNYLSYGVREFLMGAMMNGMALHGGFIPYAGTFLIFSDYAKSAIRLSALMRQRVIWILTHDSIGLGEDGPTHQPVEQLCTLRLIPNVDVWRPADATETAVAWEKALTHQGPTCLVLTRQAVPFQAHTQDQLENIAKGGYILQDCEGQPEALLIATGSEVSLVMTALELLKGRRIRVISMPSTTTFDSQPAEYRESVLPSSVRVRVAVEAGAADVWWKYVGLDGAVIGMTSFGASAPAKVLFEKFGFTPEHIAEVVNNLLR